MTLPGSPIDELREAVEAVASELANGGSATPTLERPKKAGFGDYSTNAAMLLAPRLKAPPRDVAERLGAALTERMGERIERVEVAGPGFLNVFLSDAWYAAAAAHVLAAGDDWGGGTAEHARAREPRVRVREPDRPADRGERAPRRLRRRPRAAARVRRPRGRPRVLLQRRRRAAAAARPVDPRPRARRGRPRGRLPGRVRRRAGGRAAGRGRARPRGPRGGRRRADDRAHPGHARALPRALRRLVLRARAARRRDRERVRARREGGPQLPPRGRPVAADDRVRRRPGPRDREVQRRARRTTPPTSPTSRTSSSAAGSA